MLCAGLLVDGRGHELYRVRRGNVQLDRRHHLGICLQRLRDGNLVSGRRGGLYQLRGGHVQPVHALDVSQRVPAVRGGLRELAGRGELHAVRHEHVLDWWRVHLHGVPVKHLLRGRGVGLLSAGVLR